MRSFPNLALHFSSSSTKNLSATVVRSLVRKTRCPRFDPQLRCLNFLRFSVPMSVLFFFRLVCWEWIYWCICPVRISLFMCYIHRIMCSSGYHIRSISKRIHIDPVYFFTLHTWGATLIEEPTTPILRVTIFCELQLQW